MTQSNLKRRAAVAAVTVFLLSGAAVAQAQELDQLLNLEKQVAQADAASQATIDKIADETDQLVAQYRQVTTQIDNIKIYNDQLQQLVDAQEKEKASLQAQIENVSGVEREIVPMMQRMIGTLEQFIKLDVPFRLQERLDRVANLRELMARADVSTAEKYRRLTEAYQIEGEAGRSIDSYQGPLELGGASRQVNYLSIGRVALLYQTLDAAETGMWDQKSRQWITLPESYRSQVRKALQIARKQAAPDILILPVTTPESAR